MGSRGRKRERVDKFMRIGRTTKMCDNEVVELLEHICNGVNGVSRRGVVVVSVYRGIVLHHRYVFFTAINFAYVDDCAILIFDGCGTVV